MIKMKTIHLGETESGKRIEIGTEVEYISHSFGDCVNVKLPDGSVEVISGGCLFEQ